MRDTTKGRKFLRRDQGGHVQRQYLSLTVVFLLVVTLISCGGGGGGDGAAAPTAPAAVTVDAGNGQVTLHWTPVAGATSYNLYQGTAPGITKTTGIKVGTNITTSTFTVNGLANGTPYFFLVTAVNSAGESGVSVVKTATPSATPPPAAPVNFSGEAGDGKAALSWDASTGSTSYNIYYDTTSGVTKTSGTKVTGAVSPKDVTGLTNGTTYFFVATAVNANGESAESFEVSVTPAAFPPPAAPPGVTATAGNGQVTVGWSAVTGATSYNIYWSTTSGVTKSNGTKITGATSPYIHTGRTNGTPYYCIVTSVNSYGESSESSQVSATPSISGTAPSAPTGVTATAGDGQITISWSVVSFATYYNVYWSTTSGVTKTNGTKITGATSPYNHTGRTNGTPYYYVVTSVNGDGESGESSQVSATPTASPSGLNVHYVIEGVYDPRPGQQIPEGQVEVIASMTMPNGGVSQGNTLTPYTSSTRLYTSGEIISVSAESILSYTTITVKIYRDGVLWKSNTATATGYGNYAVATASGTL